MAIGQSSKELSRGLFELRDLARVPFIPWVCSFAAQLEQVEIEEMLSDAGLLSRSLMNAQKLFGYDAIVSVFDTSWKQKHVVANWIGAKPKHYQE